MSRVSRSSSCALLLLAAASACGVDERPLTYEYHPLDVAGSSGSAGRGSSSGSANGGDSGAADGGKTAESGGGGGVCASCGGANDAGAPPELGGDAGSASPSAGAGNAGNAGAGSGGSPAAGASNAGSAGQAGGSVAFPCGDLNQDLVDDCQQTLVLNSRFDSAASDWDLEPLTTRVWDASNASGKAGSGSLQVSNVQPIEQAGGATLAGSRQCIPVAPMTNYDFAANVMIAPGQAAGQAGLNAWLFDDDACVGNLVTGSMPIAGGESGKWTAIKGKLWIPGGVHSMYVRLVAIKPFTQASLSVFIDDVLVAKRQ